MTPYDLTSPAVQNKDRNAPNVIHQPYPPSGGTNTSSPSKNEIKMDIVYTWIYIDEGKFVVNLAY